MSNQLYLGANKVDNVYLGSTKASAVYLGANKVWPSFTAPLAPTPIAPSGEVPKGSWTFTAVYHSTDGKDCNAYALRLTPGPGGQGTYYYWNAATGTRGSTEVWNFLTSPVPDGGTITVNATGLGSDADNQWWSMNTQESGALLQGVYSDPIEFYVDIV